jgi:hypothetical protein
MSVLFRLFHDYSFFPGNLGTKYLLSHASKINKVCCFNTFTWDIQKTAPLKFWWLLVFTLRYRGPEEIYNITTLLFPLLVLLVG